MGRKKIERGAIHCAPSQKLKVRHRRAGIFWDHKTGTYVFNFLNH
jgi:hypothetical protein